jgi:hypothetical protein
MGRRRLLRFPDEWAIWIPVVSAMDRDAFDRFQ